jgi:hypothetical protein
MDDAEKTLDAVWIIDSETGEELLINRQTNEVLARRDREGIKP